jgi:hypothetical protein
MNNSDRFVLLKTITAVREKNVTIAGYPGWRLEYTTTYLGFLENSEINREV